MMHADAILEVLNRWQPDMVEGLRELVVIESPSRDKNALDALLGTISDRFSDLQLIQEILPNALGGDHLRMTLKVESALAPALVLCHFDTVWPTGTLETLPFRVEADRIYGPGVYDMKASLVIVEFAIRALRELGLKPSRPVVLLFTSDEEIGSPTSRTLIEDEARKSQHVLVMEPPLEGGKLKTARKGVGRFELEVLGRAAHAGVEPEKGLNAIVELAHQILKVESLADPELGTTLNVGLIEGGTTPNVVPARAFAAIDARVSTLEEAERIELSFQGFKPVNPEVMIAVKGEFNRPPMERTERGIKLFEQVREIGGQLGLDLHEGSTGGGSDGNFTAAIGTPTIDGLGMPGAGAHARTEHVLTEFFAERVALLALLLLQL